MGIINNINDKIGCVVKNGFKSVYVQEDEFRYINFIFTPFPIADEQFNNVIKTLKSDFSSYVDYVDIIIHGELFNIYLKDETLIRRDKINKILGKLSN